MYRRNAQVVRVLKIVRILEASQRGRTVLEIYAEIKRDHPVEIRTIYRDLEAIEEAGYILEKIGSTDASDSMAMRWKIKKK